MSVQVRWLGSEAFVNWLRSQVSGKDRALLTMGRVALHVQNRLKANLESAVYSQPESPHYTRTRTLDRSVHASPTEDGHEDDTERARNADLAVDSPQRAASVDGNRVQSFVGSWASYAGFVNDGTANMHARPFLTDADVAAAEDELADAFESMLAAELGS